MSRYRILSIINGTIKIYYYYYYYNAWCINWIDPYRIQENGAVKLEHVRYIFIASRKRCPGKDHQRNLLIILRWVEFSTIVLNPESLGKSEIYGEQFGTKWFTFQDGFNRFIIFLRCMERYLQCTLSKTNTIFIPCKNSLLQFSNNSLLKY